MTWNVLHYARMLKDTVIAVVVTEPADFFEPEPIPVERDDRVKAVGVAGDAQLHQNRSQGHGCSLP